DEPDLAVHLGELLVDREVLVLGEGAEAATDRGTAAREVVAENDDEAREEARREQRAAAPPEARDERHARERLDPRHDDGERVEPRRREDVVVEEDARAVARIDELVKARVDERPADDEPCHERAPDQSEATLHHSPSFVPGTIASARVPGSSPTTYGSLARTQPGKPVS